MAGNHVRVARDIHRSQLAEWEESKQSSDIGGGESSEVTLGIGKENSRDFTFRVARVIPAAMETRMCFSVR